MPNTFDRLKAALADRYAIERELGSGGMATVYLAEDLKHHRKVAVKVRPLGDNRNKSRPRRFLIHSPPGGHQPVADPAANASTRTSRLRRL